MTVENKIKIGQNLTYVKILIFVVVTPAEVVYLIYVNEDIILTKIFVGKLVPKCRSVFVCLYVCPYLVSVSVSFSVSVSDFVSPYVSPVIKCMCCS